MATRYNINSTVQRVVNGVLEPGSGASAIVTDPSSNPITVYAAETGAGQVSNPIATTSFGRIEGWVDVPDYNITVSGSGITTYTEYVRKSPQGVVALAGSSALNWGTGWGVSDTNLYRSAASVLKTDDAFQAVLDLTARQGASTQVVAGDVAGNAGLTFGSAGDTNLYRSGASALKTDDAFTMAAGATVTGGRVTVDRPSGNSALFVNVTGEGNYRYHVDMSGVQTWGTGTGAGDTTLYRNGIGILKTDGILQVGTTVNAGSGYQVGGTALAATHLSDTALLARLASPTFTGTPAAPTAAANTNTTQIATTAYVVGQAGTATPLVEGTATPGVSLKYAREDHVHPSLAANPSFSGTVTAANLTVTGNTLLGDAGTDTIGVFGVAGVVRQSATADIKDALTAYGWLQGTSATPLNLDGGTLTAGIGSFSSDVTVGGAFDHNGSTAGFYGKAPVAINSTAFSNGAGVSVSQYDLPSGFTMNQLAGFVMTLARQLGDINGVGLINTTV